MKGRLAGAALGVLAAMSSVALATPGALEAQAPMVGARMASRQDLTALLDSLQRTDTSVLNEDSLSSLADRVQALATRLEMGDIWPGDQVTLDVSGESKWTGQFVVNPGRALELPDIDPVSLAGTLYSEVEESVARQLSAYLREPRVRVTVLRRIGVLGEVGSPGFLDVPGSTLVSQLVMLAGGPTSQADLNKLVFRRLGTRVAPTEGRAAWQSRSLDELGLVSGDEVFVPTRASFVLTRVLAVVLGTAATITIIATRL